MPDTIPLVNGIEAIISVVPDEGAALDSFTALGFAEVWRNGGGEEHVSGAVSSETPSSSSAPRAILTAGASSPSSCARAAASA